MNMQMSQFMSSLHFFNIPLGERNTATKEITSMILRISLTFSEVVCTVIMHVNSKEFRKV